MFVYVRGGWSVWQKEKLRRPAGFIEFPLNFVSNSEWDFASWGVKDSQVKHGIRGYRKNFLKSFFLN